MTIKSGQQIPVTAVGTGDTTVLSSAAQTSKEVWSLTLHNTGATDNISVELFLSSDGTSATGERIAQEYLDAAKTKSIRPFVVPATYFLIAKASVAGVNAYGIFTLRTGADV